MYKVVLESSSPIKVTVEEEGNNPSPLRFTLSDLQSLAPSGNPSYLEFLASDEAQQIMAKYGILDNPLRLVHFLGQVGAETGGFKRIREDGNYSATRLREIFPRYFTVAEAKAYAGDPVRILSRAYANRLGNGNEASQDGWTYRGYGWLQVTGKTNYEKFGITPSSTFSELLEASLQYWDKLNLNYYADRNLRLAISRGVNVGKIDTTITPNGMADRRYWFNKAWPIFRKYEKENPINV